MRHRTGQLRRGASDSHNWRSFLVLLLVVLLAVYLAGGCGVETGARSAEEVRARPRGSARAPAFTGRIVPAVRSASDIGRLHRWIAAYNVLVSPRGDTVPLPSGIVVAPVLSGDLSPVAVQVDDDRVIYQAWEPAVAPDPSKTDSERGIEPGDPLGTLSIRLYDHHLKKHRVLIGAAASFALAADGRLAYVATSSPTVPAGGPYDGTVEVRPDLTSEQAETWVAAPDRYVVAGWAGDTLLLYRIGPLESLHVYAVHRGDPPKLLAADSRLVALSENGRSALVARGSPSEPPMTLSLVDVATAKVVAELERPAVPGETRDLFVSSPGAWQGDYVVAPGGGFSGAVLFRISGTRLNAIAALDIGFKMYPWGVAATDFAHDGRVLLVGRHPSTSNPALLEGFVLACSRTAPASCEEHRPSQAQVAGLALASAP